MQHVAGAEYHELGQHEIRETEKKSQGKTALEYFGNFPHVNSLHRKL